MGVEIILAALLLGSAYAIGEKLREMRSRILEQEESSEETDIQVLGEVLPMQRRFQTPLPRIRQAGEPLWENHRLYERLTGQAQRNRHLVNYLRQNHMFLEETPLTNAMPSLFDQGQRQGRDQLEDPFAQGDARGWSFQNGRRESL